MCIAYCPTTFTAGVSKPECTAPGDALVFHEAFNTFEGPWGILSTDTGNATGTYPAKLRGQYFDGSDYMTVSAFTLAPDFAVMAWIRLPSVTGVTNTVLSKDRFATTPGPVMTFAVIDGGFLSVGLGYTANDYAALSPATSTATNKVAINTWT
jgi:hypothetical protein